MSAIPDFGASIPKKFKSASMGDIPALDMKALFRLVVLGPSFSGKNNLCMFILKHSPHVFAHLTIIARNPHQELYEYLRDKLEGFITYADPDTPPKVDQVRHTPYKPQLVIIDDYSNDKLLQKNIFSHYYTRGRHFKLLTIFLSHSYFATDKMIRLNSEYVAMLKANSKRDLQMVVKDFNIRGVDERSIVYYYNKATERKGQMLFVDSLPGSAADFKDVACAVQSTSMYNSEYNIDTTQFSNNSCKINVPTAGTTSSVSVILPDGLYSYSDIHRSIQTALVNAGAYLINPSGENVFYIQLTENSVGLYSSGGTGLPTTTRVPRLIIDNASFGNVVGLTAGTYPSASATVSSAQLSNTIPQIHPTSSYIVRCDLIKNEYVACGDILSAFDRGDAQVGQLVSYKQSQYAWMNCINGSRTSITISIFNQNDTKVKFRDTSVLIMLLFRPKK
ncbi:unnamed protein product [Phytophthora lilii]|uniref:Unnamed protein product n=1 Tax=Phytophthora lilii TaxID=2077276 RepID=A0A9W6XK51_9STRA|nr:unnamed protein product [Phytophthora lilii]